MSRRAHAGLGVYGVKLFDFDRAHGHIEVPDEEANIDPDVAFEGYQEVAPVYTYSNRSVAVFVLDIRSNKSPWKQGSEAYLPDYEGDFLGEHQWRWFEAAIKRSKAAVNVVISGVQVHPNVFPNGDIAESWNKYPRAQQRLFDALLEDGVQAPIIVSGDVHMNQMMRKDCQRADGSSHRRPLFEMTTSGMTHSWGDLSSPPLSYPDQRPTLFERYESFVASTVMHLMHRVSPWTALMLSDTFDTSKGRSRRQSKGRGLMYSLEKNFGELEFDWEHRLVLARTIGEDSEPLLSAEWSMDQLSGMTEVSSGVLTEHDFSEEAKLHGSMVQREWICVNHRGRPSAALQTLGHMMTLISFATMLLVPLFLPCCLILFVIRRSLRRTQSSFQDSSTSLKV
jgi:PhoD-like phosphatase